MRPMVYIVSFASILTACTAAVAQYAQVTAKQPPPQPRMIEVGDITDYNVAAISARITRQIEQGQTQIYLRLNSNGGGIFSGMDLIQSMEEHKKRGAVFTCVVDTRAISMGFVILQAACDKRLATSRALFLAHNGSISQTGGTQEDLQEDVDLLAVLNDNMAQICSKRMGMSLTEYKKKLKDKKSWIFGTEEALRVRAIDGVVSPLDLPEVE